MPFVLVVDDSPIDRGLVEGLLSREAELDWVVDYAQNGVEALAKMNDMLPDAVVTDLQMPRMNGLELVSAIRSSYPQIPVILMTGQGSEEIAVEALERGAASYVPKAKLAERLLSTIRQVVTTAQAGISRQRLGDCVTEASFSLRLDNDPTLIRPLIDHFQQLLSDMSFCDSTERIHVGIALEEALLNALYHGNLELPADEVREARTYLHQDVHLSSLEERRVQLPYLERRINVHAQVTPAVARFTIQDEGQGFTPEDLQLDETETMERGAGRGLLLMKSFMDEVDYDESKNLITLVKYAASADSTDDSQRASIASGETARGD